MSSAAVTTEPNSKKKAEVSPEPVAPVASQFALEGIQAAPAGLPLFLGIGLQRKLAVGAVDDPLEREADQVAERVMRSIGSSASPLAPLFLSSRKENPAIRRKCACEGSSEKCEECQKREEGLPGAATVQRKTDGTGGDSDAAHGSEAPPIVHEALCSPGRPLDPATRGLMESRFGDDFRDVRVHTDSLAAKSAQSVNALAYTVGTDVVFALDQYSPKSPHGRHLLAHELAHVVQQSDGYEIAHKREEPSTGQLRRKPTISLSGTADRTVQRQAAPQPTLPPITDKSKTLTLWTLFRGEYLLIAVRPDAETSSRFDADPGLLEKLDTALTAALAPGGVPVPETRGFLQGPVVSRLVESDLPGWVDAPDSNLPGLVSVLNDRAAEFRKQAVRADLEAYLGVNPGTIDWPTVLPSIHSDFDAKGNESAHWQSLRDRADFVLLVLETEVATAPAVVGGVVPPNLSESVWDFATAFNLAKGTSAKVFSEKYLGEYVQMIAGLEFVPAGFDLARYKPSGADLAADRRHTVLDAWIAANAAEATTRIVLDDWTTSGLDFNIYLSTLDLEAKKSKILDMLTDAFLAAAKGDQELNRALVRMADAQATYGILSRLVTTGRLAEKRNRELVAAIEDPVEHPELADLAGDPRTIYEGEFYLAQGMRNVLSHVQEGARVDVEVVTNAVAIAGKATFPPEFALGTFLLVLLTDLGALASAKETQRAHARADIAERVDLSWDAIKKIIDNRGNEAQKFLDEKWIPMLKLVANEWVDANFKELNDAYTHFSTWAPQNSARYSLAAWMIEDVANKLESGAIKSSTLSGATVTIADVKELRTAVTVLREKAKELNSPQGRDKKRDELKKAVDAYQEVKDNIASGKYKPQNYGDAVAVEAKRRLHIGVFEYTSLWQQATRQVVVRDNPFQAYTIAMWHVENIIDQAVSDLLMGLLRGVLMLGSLIVPGVGGLILAAIDIGIGVYSAAKNVGEARRRLDLARLDTQLQIQGIPVEAAEHALNMAWVSLAIELAMAGLFTALVGKMALKGIEAMRMPALTRLAESDPVLAEKLVNRMLGDTKLTDTLLRHYAGDGNKLFEALAYVKDGKSLTTLLGKVKDTEVLTSLLISTGKDTNLLELLDKFKDVNRLDRLLGVASRQQLLRLMALTKDEAMVAKLVEGMGPSKALKLMSRGLAAEQAIVLDGLGSDALKAFEKIAATGDVEAMEGMRKLLQPGANKSVAASALQRTAAFGEKYAGRVSGNFVERFAKIADSEAKLERIRGKIADLEKASKSTKNLESQLAKAEAQFARDNAELTQATDILEGRTVFGKDRSVYAIPEERVAGRKKLEGEETADFRVSGSGQPDMLAEGKRLGDETGKIAKYTIRRDFGKAASQISAEAARTGEKGGLVRLDASGTTIPKTNDEIANEIRGEWMSSIKENPARTKDVGWVEILDKGPSGESRRLLLKVEGNSVTIDSAGTTRP
jgi:hypothetical protein